VCRVWVAISCTQPTGPHVCTVKIGKVVGLGDRGLGDRDPTGRGDVLLGGQGWEDRKTNHQNFA
ncbi:MAG: hypothetical protein MUO76_06245, partial [Anaerolineaceae bacterium]|nr:hypothetical protein [Anaerolineaceae bacterium]